MRLASGIEALELRRDPSDPSRTIYPVVLWDEGGGGDGVTLVDTGAPGQMEALEAELRRVGLDVSAIRRVILTHQDLDHIGGLPQVVRASGAEVLAHPEEAPYIQGDRLLIRWSEDRRADLLRHVNPVPAARVDRTVRDGEVLPWHGGLRIIHTPGHTPGHISLYAAAAGLLIAGDALRVDGGRLLGAKRELSIDHDAAERSVEKLAALPLRIAQIHCHHGGPCGAGAGESLLRLAASRAAGDRSA